MLDLYDSMVLVEYMKIFNCFPRVLPLAPHQEGSVGQSEGHHSVDGARCHRDLTVTFLPYDIVLIKMKRRHQRR